MIVQIAVDLFGRGAIDRRARQEVTALVSAGFDVAVITTKPSSNDLEKSFLKELHGGRIELIYISTALEMRFRKFLGAVPELLFAARCYGALTRLNSKESIDLIISHAATPCYAVARFNKGRQIPTAYVVHALIWDRINASANPHSWPETQVYKYADHYALTKMDYSISVSDYIRRLAIAKGASQEKSFVLYNPVDTKIFRKDSDNSPKDIDVLFVGRLSAEKGLPTLIEAAQYLPKETKMVIIGSGSLRQQLERQSQSLACKIEFEGWVDNQLLPTYFKRSKLFVVPSLSEPQGVVVLEAMACGVPVIGSDTGGIPEMLRHSENGWLAQPQDARALANMIQAALSDEVVRSGAAASALETAQSFSTEWFTQKLPCFYKELIEKGTHSSSE